jgi:hypothetical protein
VLDPCTTARATLSPVQSLRAWVDDTEVTLAFYGSIVYLAVVSSLGAQPVPPPAAVAASAVISSAVVLYVAHVFASLVPKAARAGRLNGPDLAASLRHDLPLLVSVVVPTLPLVLATQGAMANATGYRLSVRLTIALLFALAVTLSRRDGLSWMRSVVAGLAIVGVAVAVTWLESQVH